MKCWIYRSSKKDEMYLYVNQKDQFEHVPESIMRGMGKADFVMELELDGQRSLARVDVAEVLEKLTEHGFYIQMPPRVETMAWWEEDNKPRKR